MAWSFLGHVDKCLLTPDRAHMTHQSSDSNRVQLGRPVNVPGLHIGAWVGVNLSVDDLKVASSLESPSQAGGKLMKGFSDLLSWHQAFSRLESPFSGSLLFL